MLSTVRKFKQDGMLRVYGTGPGTNMHLTEAGKQYLFDLERKLRRVRINS